MLRIDEGPQLEHELLLHVVLPAVLLAGEAPGLRRVRGRGARRASVRAQFVQRGGVRGQSRGELARGGEPGLVARDHRRQRRPQLAGGLAELAQSARVGEPQHALRALLGQLRLRARLLLARLDAAVGRDELVVLVLQHQRGDGRTARDHQDQRGGRGGEGTVAPDPLAHLGQGAGLVGVHDAALEPGAQVVGQRLHARVALRRLARHRLRAHRDELRRRGRRALLERLGRARAHALPDRERIAVRAGRHVGRVPGEQAVEQRARGVHVGGGPDRRDLAARLLGRHVGGRADDVAVHRHQGRLRVAGADLAAARVDLRRRPGRRRDLHAQVGAVGPVEHAREPPVHHVHLAILADHHVGRLEVAVQHALRVRVGHRLADLEQHAQRARQRPAFASLARGGEDRLQIAPRDQPHREVHAALGVQAHLVHRHDAGVVQLRGDLRLLEEAVEQARIDARDRAGLIASARGTHDLHRQLAAQVLVPDAQHRAHAAVPDLAAHAVARRQCRTRGEALDDLLQREHLRSRFRSALALVCFRRHERTSIRRATAACKPCSRAPADPDAITR